MLAIFKKLPRKLLPNNQNKFNGGILYSAEILNQEELS